MGTKSLHFGEASALIKSKEEAYDETSLSARLKLAMRLLGVNQSELARRINIKPQIIQYLCNKNVKASRFTFEIAEALGVDYTWLSTGDGSMYPIEQNTVENVKVPFIRWSDLGYLFIKGDTATEAGNFVFSNIASEKGCYALKLEDISMEPRFEKGTTIIFDTTESPRDGDFVLANLKAHSVWVFREYQKDGEVEKLIPLNKNLYKEVVLTNDDHVFGVLIQTICDYKHKEA